MPATLNQAEAGAMIRGFNDHAKFCSHLEIKNKEGVPVQYRNSCAGQKLNRSIRKQELARVPVRQVVLKAAQVWMSSSTATEVFRRVPFFPGRRALVLADTDLHAGLVFEYYEQYIRSYLANPYGSEFGAALLLPELEKDTERHLRWRNGSSILVGTANNAEIGRSAPFNWVQLSEAAFYRDMSTLMTGLMQRVPHTLDSGVIVETTANGVGGPFYDLWKQASDPRRASGWAAVFFAYWEHPENVMVVPAGFKLMRDELEELQKYNLTVPQIVWRRWMIETACEGKVERFRQEHPGNSEEAFQATGRTIFDMAAVARLPIVADAPRGRLELVDLGIEQRIQFRQSEDGRGELVIYKQPRKGGHYIIGSDHAEGVDPLAKEKGAGGSDPDYGSATVMDCDTGEEMAKLKERYEPHPWAQRLFHLGKFYNWAFQCPEAKAVGKAVIGKLLELSYPSELIYSKQRDPSDRRPALLQELGHDTNTVFRPVLISKLDGALRDGSIGVHDPETIDQLRRFVRKPNGREEGVGHDDDVFGLALCIEGLPYARRAFVFRDSLANQHLAKPTKYGRKGDEDED